MSLLPEWLNSITFRRATRRVEQDLADMGTAFGLDASFDEERSFEKAQQRGPLQPAATPGSPKVRPEPSPG